MFNYQFRIHPAAETFPPMTEEEFQGLKEDIAENGQREDIVVWKGQLIDGRHRLRACEELQRNPSIAELDSDQDPVAYVISHNFHRRNLTTTQRAAVAAKIAKLKNGGDRGNQHTGGKCANFGRVSKDTLADAAKALNVSRESVARARSVQAHGSEAVQQAMEQDELPVTLAAQLVKAVPDKKEQTKLLKQGVEAVREAVKAKEPKAKPLEQHQSTSDGESHAGDSEASGSIDNLRHRIQLKLTDCKLLWNWFTGAEKVQICTPAEYKMLFGWYSDEEKAEIRAWINDDRDDWR